LKKLIFVSPTFLIGRSFPLSVGNHAARLDNKKPLKLMEQILKTLCRNIFDPLVIFFMMKNGINMGGSIYMTIDLDACIAIAIFRK
jgi:hypothetical protein